MNDLPGWAKHGTVWLLLGAGVFLGVQAWQSRAQATRFSVASGVVEIERGPDGHYHWPGNINGQAVDFLVDTGATGTAGGVVQGQVVVADLALLGGVAAQRLRIVALPGLGAPLLGMDVLGRLRWEQYDGRLRVHAAGSAP